MTKQNEYKPEYLMSPGEVVHAYATEFMFSDDSLSVARLINKCELTSDEYWEIVNSRKPITPAIAEKLAKLGKPAEYWIGLERQYQEERQRLSGISPWHKVEGEEPPKDASVIGQEETGEYIASYHAEALNACFSFEEADEDQEWEWVNEVNGERFPYIPFDKWTPIPGGEE